MLNTSFSPWPSYSTEEVDAVKNVLLSGKVNYWTGLECREFEKRFAVFAESDFAIAVANGTVALDLALKSIDIAPGDEVIVTPRTFMASVSCIVNAGAVPVFADVDQDTQNITAESISSVLSDKTKAIICVHLAGWPCDMDPILSLARSNNLYVIEDCAQAHGARYKGKSVGSIGDVAAWSFCQDKIMTTAGEGGMLTTSNKNIWLKAWSYKDHGKSWDAVYNKQHEPGFRWLHESFGTNWRMTEIQAAVGLIQLKKMSAWTSRRNIYAGKILQTGKELAGLKVPEPRCNGCTAVDNAGCPCLHAFYKCYMFVESEKLNFGWSRDRIIKEIIARGVPCYSGTCSEVYLEKAFDETGWRPKERLPVAKKLGEVSLMFLVHPTLSESEIRKTCVVLKEVMLLAGRRD